jgi:hypothetical protein
VSDTNNFILPTYTHVANTQLIVVWGYDSSGMKASAVSVGGILPAATSNAFSTDAVLGSTMETGSRDGALQFQGEVIFNGTFNSFQQAIDYINDHNLADTSNL